MDDEHESASSGGAHGVKEIASSGEFSNAMRYGGLVVADFFATWCGPCTMIAPFMEQMASKYPEVKFIKVDVDKHQELAQQYSVKAMPTFIFFVAGKQVDVLQGADPTKLEAAIVRHKKVVDPFANSKAYTTGGGTTGHEGAPALSAREARLAKYGQQPLGPYTSSLREGGGGGGADAEAAAAAAAAALIDDEEAQMARALALSMGEAPPAAASSSSASSGGEPMHVVPPSAPAKEGGADRDAMDAQDQAEAEAQFAANESAKDNEWGEEMVPLPVDETMLAELLSMGFSDTRARKGIHHGSNVEGAINWLAANESDPNIDQPYMVRKADTLPKRVLTEEEKKEAVQRLKVLAQQRRADRERAEKAEELKREKERRERGQKIDDTQEKRDQVYYTHTCTHTHN